MLHNKIFTSADKTEVIEALADDIYRELLQYSEKLGSYQEAINVLQKRLEALIKVSPHNRMVIKKAADIAGEYFLKVTGEVKHQNNILSQISVKQKPPQEG